MSIFESPTYVSQHAFPAITTTSSAQAVIDVLAYAGSWPRDAMTTRTFAEYNAGTGTLGKVDDALNTDTTPAPPTDTDVDGIPDTWETANSLNPNDDTDSKAIHASGYANIEVYLNEVAETITGQAPAGDTLAPAAPIALRVSMLTSSTDSPAYITALADYEVANLAGALAPTNGTSDMDSVTPTEWQNNDPGTGDLQAVLTAWSGGAKMLGSKLIVHGGGHTDSANNGVYIFDFSGTTAPIGWDSPLIVSDVADVTEDTATYSDGRPTSIHTYDGMVYATHNDHIYRFLGAIYGPTGSGTQTSFKFNMATGSWSQLPNYPHSTVYGGMKTIYDAVSGNIFVLSNEEFDGYFFRTDDDTYSGIKSFSEFVPWNSSGAWDSSRGRGIIVGDDANTIFTLNFSTETVTTSTFTPTGDTTIFSDSGFSAVYDTSRDVYWLFGGPTAGSGWTTIYEMDAGTWVTTAHTLTGDSITRVGGMIGSFGRFAYMDDWRAIGIVGSGTQPVSLIKLP